MLFDQCMLSRRIEDSRDCTECDFTAALRGVCVVLKLFSRA